MTRKLYYSNSKLTEFEAEVIDNIEKQQGTALILDRTAFYPEGGGQPGDTGTIGDSHVIDTTADEQGDILHWVKTSDSLPRVGENVLCTIDTTRRKDHSQQHSAQHILSRAFLRLFDWETVSFHLGERTSTIDLSVDKTSWDNILQAENMANETVFANIPCHIESYQSPDELPQQVRRTEEVNSLPDHSLRVVSFGDFDSVLCGGTHADRSGNIGLIKALHTERVRARVRLHFAAGNRAADWFEKHRSAAVEMKRLLTTGLDDLPDAAERLQAENRQLLKQNRQLKDELCVLKADELLNESEGMDSKRVVSFLTDSGSYELKNLAKHLTVDRKVVALLASRDESSAKFVFACSEEINLDCAELLRDSLQPYNGGGGGGPTFAQGGGVKADEARDVLRKAEELTRKRLF